jgi:hypothetical protein
MKRFPVIGMLLLIPAFGLAVMVGCDKPPANKGGDDGSKKGPPKVVQKGEAKEIAGALEGVVKGVVKFPGTAPEAKPEPGMADHKDKAVCMAGGGKNVVQQKWLVKDGLVENVIVSLAPADGKKFKEDEALKKKFAKATIELDQPFCQFVPHAIGIYAEVQPLMVKNSASIPHNTKISGTPDNPQINKNLGKGEKAGPYTFVMQGPPLLVQCDVHNWMTAKIITFEHPYFARTNDKGEFSIANVPVDEELTVYMWHESMDEKKSMGTVTTKKGDTVKDLEISGK